MTVERNLTGDEQDELPGVERLLALSDGVVAIALTLLVLNLRVPSGPQYGTSAAELWDYLVDDSNVFFSYLVSFFVIAQFWLAHHRVFRLMRGHDEGLAWWNFVFLLFITLLPFTSELHGRLANNPLAVAIFAVNLLLANLSTQAVVGYARHRHLLVPGASEHVLRQGRTRVLMMSTVIAVSIGVAWVSTSIASDLWILLIFVPLFARRLDDRRHRPPSEVR